LAITLRALRAAGATRATLCVSHLREQIEDEFGKRWSGLDIDYCYDLDGLGTAGPLRQLTDWTTPALVMNGDILTTLDFGRLHRAHTENRNALTVATQRREFNVPFGVLDFAENGRVRGIQEKPAIPMDVSTGIYVIDPEVRDLLPEGVRTDMPSLVRALAESGRPVGAYPFTDTWHDVGTPQTYEAAQRDFLAGPHRYLARESAGTSGERP